MISKFHLFAAALAGVLICSVAGAQVRNGCSLCPAADRACEACREGIGKSDAACRNCGFHQHGKPA